MPTYNLKDVHSNIAGIRVTGAGETDFVTVARDEDSFTKKAGADGEVTRSKTNNIGGRATYTLMQNSRINAIFHALVEADEETGSVTFPWYLVDLRSGKAYAATTCWLLRPTDTSFNKEVGEVEWVVEMEDLEVVQVPFADEFDLAGLLADLPLGLEIPFQFL